MIVPTKPKSSVLRVRTLPVLVVPRLKYSPVVLELICSARPTGFVHLVTPNKYRIWLDGSLRSAPPKDPKTYWRELPLYPGPTFNTSALFLHTKFGIPVSNLCLRDMEINFLIVFWSVGLVNHVQILSKSAHCIQMASPEILFLLWLMVYDKWTYLLPHQKLWTYILNLKKVFSIQETVQQFTHWILSITANTIT